MKRVRSRFIRHRFSWSRCPPRRRVPGAGDRERGAAPAFSFCAENTLGGVGRLSPGALSSESPRGLRLRRAPSLAWGVRAARPALRAPRASPGARRGLASLPALSKSTPGARTAPSGQGEPGGLSAQPTGSEPTCRSAWRLAVRGDRGPGLVGAVSAPAVHKGGSSGGKGRVWGCVSVQLQVPHRSEPVQAGEGLSPGTDASSIRDATRAALGRSPRNSQHPSDWPALPLSERPPEHVVPAERVPAPTPQPRRDTGCLKVEERQVGYVDIATSFGVE